MQTFLRYRCLCGVVIATDIWTRRELWDLYRLQTDCYGRFSSGHEVAVEFVLVETPTEFFGYIADVVDSSSPVGGAGPVLIFTQTNPKLHKNSLVQYGLTSEILGPGWIEIVADAHDVDADVLLIHESALQTVPVLHESGTSSVSQVIFTGLPRDGRDFDRRVAIAKELFPGARLRQLLDLHDPEIHPGDPRWWWKLLLRVSGESSLKNWSARNLFHALVRQRSAALRGMRSEHRASGAKFGKFLAFSRGKV